ncbi:MAG: hypothetical protein JO305_07205 [Alphaproteobacteria bacterium]|nr:hypothetical protein [Alphaproteobacteria bacterium]
MTIRMLTNAALGAACLAAVAAMPAARAQMASEPPPALVTNGPQSDPGDHSSWSASRNVRESRDYEALVRSNPGFRDNRIQKECGPITDPQLHASCIASFGEFEGSSTPPRQDRDYH